MLEASRPYLLRIVGPNCVGLLVPGLGLNASFAHASALPGRLAFISQSGGLTTAALDWARSRNIGFSHFISIGEAADVDFADVLDWLASDAQTSAILLYIESIRGARKFMSAAACRGAQQAGARGQSGSRARRRACCRFAYRGFGRSRRCIRCGDPASRHAPSGYGAGTVRRSGDARPRATDLRRSPRHHDQRRWPGRDGYRCFRTSEAES